MRWRVPLAVVFLLGFAGMVKAAVRWADVLRQTPEWYAGEEAGMIATSILQYQTREGGWPKNRDMTMPPDKAFLAETKHDERSPTIDNNATTTQIQFLALVASARADAAAQRGALRGIDYLLAAQFANGGWPQYFPLIMGYYTHITYNDNATVNVLSLLSDVSRGGLPYQFIHPANLAKVSAAVQRGIACILRTQIKQGGKLTAWCAQHDEITFLPVAARNFEPASLSGQESVGLARFLMTINRPSPKVILAVESAVDWLTAVAIPGMRLDTSPGADGAKDRRVVADPAAPEIWARFYELETNRPIFVGRDKVVCYDYNEIERERRVGYAYLGDWPAKLIVQEYPAWRAKNHLP